MQSTIFQTSSLPVLEQVVQFSQARHAVLAGNIANLDTPGYRARDLSPEHFQTRLKAAIAARDRPAASASLLASGSAPMAQDRGLEEVGENLESIVYHDDSNVGLEQQVTEMAKNQGQHNLALAIMSSQFRLLQAVISERA